ncbi:hypothetical protein Pla123a_10850 [Posidoniimonas polymericola]|uniref:PEP-CTERM protein-sorting domain-containing protein n=1 Tax=Posidoniimonas polymericola TaxID=2528002 RepID=A0A5C5YTG8_9BACT|nr:hypothetical protein [Posidoniimonas polymericola]TWT78294.1 hypothetical protein Pla123a_10850 [Posidoniimonas polymericola]
MNLSRLRCCVASLAAFLILICECRADLVNHYFDLAVDGTAASPDDPNLIELQKTNLQVGDITFNATLRVTSSHSFTFFTLGDPSGLGVKSSEDFHQVDGGEWLHFTLEVTNPTGGPVPEARLSFVDYSTFSFLPPPEIYLSPSSTIPVGTAAVQSTAGEIDVVELPEWVETELYSIAGADISTSRHLVKGITATFTTAVAAVPEPTGFLFGTLVAAAAAWSSCQTRRRCS